MLSLSSFLDLMKLNTDVACRGCCTALHTENSSSHIVITLNSVAIPFDCPPRDFLVPLIVWFTLQRDRMRDRGWERKRCCAGEKLNQWLNYCMIAHSPKTWASFGRKCLIIGFRPCQTHAIPPTNGSVRKNWASWVREGQKIARRQKALRPSPFFPSDKWGTDREKETQREGKRWQEGGSVYVSKEEMKWQ